MKVLLVEDNMNKRNAIANFYCSEFPADEFKTADSLIEGLRKARDCKPDIILLDMSLPNHSSSSESAGASDMLPFAGKNFLLRVKRMKFDTKVIVVSMFETFGVAPNITTLAVLHEEMKERYPTLYLGAVHYSPSDEEWQFEISNFRRLLEG
jgi:CheY-like chemotaxis protein